MHIPDDPSSTRILLHPRRHRASDRGHHPRQDRSADLLDQCIRRRSPDRASGRAKSCSTHRHRLHPSEKTEYGRHSHESWELIQRSHAVANGASSALPTASAWKGSWTRLANLSAPTAWSSGARASSPPNGQIVKKASSDQRRFCWRIAIWKRVGVQPNALAVLRVGGSMRMGI